MKDPRQIGSLAWRRVVGANLRTARLLAGLSGREVARRTGLHRQTFARIERGRTGPNRATFARLCALYRVSMNDVLTLEGGGP